MVSSGVRLHMISAGVRVRKYHHRCRYISTVVINTFWVIVICSKNTLPGQSNTKNSVVTNLPDKMKNVKKQIQNANGNLFKNKRTSIIKLLRIVFGKVYWKKYASGVLYFVRYANKNVWSISIVWCRWLEKLIFIAWPLVFWRIAFYDVK